MAYNGTKICYLINENSNSGFIGLSRTSRIEKTFRNGLQTISQTKCKAAQFERCINALIYAVSYKHTELVKLLLESGASKYLQQHHLLNQKRVYKKHIQ